MDLDSFKPDHWWNVLAKAGGLIAVAAVPAQFAAAFLIGLGLLFLGAGEWVNRPRQTRVKGANVVGLYKVTGNPTYCLANQSPSSLSDLDWISARRSILPRIGSSIEPEFIATIEYRWRAVFRHRHIVGARRWRALSRG